VAVRLTGQILDENYTRLLLSATDLELGDVMALDRVQKKQPINEDAFKRLKGRKLIEGRRPNLFVAAKVAAATGDKAAYIKNRAFDKAHYKSLVIAYLGEFQQASRTDIDQLLWKKLSDALTEKQRRHSVTNLLQEMKREQSIRPLGATRGARWELFKPTEKRRD
jgi:ATP-dependent DNA helicase RecG